MAEAIFADEMAKEALDTARNVAGGNAGLARRLGKLTSQAVSQWKHVPARRVLDVERVTGVPRNQLRPDLYPISEALEWPADALRSTMTASEGSADE